MPKLEGFDLWDHLDEELDEMRAVDELPKTKPLMPLTEAEKYREYLEQVRPMRSNFHDRLAERAGVEADETEEIMQLIAERRRLKRGGID